MPPTTLKQQAMPSVAMPVLIQPLLPLLPVEGPTPTPSDIGVAS